jgi:hypothetical protein
MLPLCADQLLIPCCCIAVGSLVPGSSLASVLSTAHHLLLKLPGVVFFGPFVLELYLALLFPVDFASYPMDVTQNSKFSRTYLQIS